MRDQVFLTNYKPGGEPQVTNRLVELVARRVASEHRDEAQLTLKISDAYKSGRCTFKVGSLQLSPDEARALALAICPELNASRG